MSRLDTNKIRNLCRSSETKNGLIPTTNDIAKELDLSHKVITRMQNDKDYNPGILTVLKLADYFNVSLDSLVIRD